MRNNMASTVAVVHCEKHGKNSADKFRWAGKAVQVPIPKSKSKRKNGGCPFCKKEQSGA